MASVSGVCDPSLDPSYAVLTDGCMVPPPSDPHMMMGVHSPTASSSMSHSSAIAAPSCHPSGAAEPCGETIEESWQQIKAVQGLIERCLQQHMNRGEVVAALQARANVEPSLTHLVWQKLEEQNPDFFNAYDIQLRLKDQILVFNCLVQEQINLMVAYSGAAAGVMMPPTLAMPVPTLSLPAHAQQRNKNNNSNNNTSSSSPPAPPRQHYCVTAQGETISVQEI